MAAAMLMRGIGGLTSLIVASPASLIVRLALLRRGESSCYRNCACGGENEQAFLKHRFSFLKPLSVTRFFNQATWAR
jgi:hypothetical protein